MRARRAKGEVGRGKGEGREGSGGLALVGALEAPGLLLDQGLAAGAGVLEGFADVLRAALDRLADLRAGVLHGAAGLAAGAAQLHEPVVLGAALGLAVLDGPVDVHADAR